MDDPLRLITHEHGVFLRREAIECGYDDKGVARMLRAGVWKRVRHGCYAFADVWGSYTREEQHLCLAKAVLRTTPGPVVLSHTTALLAHGTAVWGADLSRVHVTRLDTGAARIEKDVVHHVGSTRTDAVMQVGGLPVVAPARAVVEAATILPLESALVSADSALFRRQCDEDELRRMFASMHHWPGSQKIHVVLMQMDGRAESPGETRARHLFRFQGLPVPDLQFEVYDGSRLIAVTDFVWHAQKRFGEFDGRIKYGRLLKPGQQPGDVVFEEKVREDAVRDLTGYGCGRLIWTDLDRPTRTRDRFRRILGLD